MLQAWSPSPPSHRFSRPSLWVSPASQSGTSCPPFARTTFRLHVQQLMCDPWLSQALHLAPAAAFSPTVSTPPVLALTDRSRSLCIFSLTCFSCCRSGRQRQELGLSTATIICISFAAPCCESLSLLCSKDRPIVYFSQFQSFFSHVVSCATQHKWLNYSRFGTCIGTTCLYIVIHLVSSDCRE